MAESKIDSPDFISDDDAKKQASSEPPDFIPDEPSEKETSTLSAVGHGLLSGASLGASEEGYKVRPAPVGEMPTEEEAERLNAPQAEFSKEELEKEKQEHPIASGVGEAIGTGLPLAVISGGVGLTGVGGKIATMSPGLKYGANVLKSAGEFAALSGASSTTKALATDQSPEDAVGPALTNMGVSGLIAGTASGLAGAPGLALKGIGKSYAGTAASKFLEDFGNRWKFNLENPDINDALREELENFYASTGEHADEIRGFKGLKGQAIEKLSKDVSPEQLSAHISDVKQLLSKVPAAIRNDPLFQNEVDKWTSRAVPQVDPLGMTTSQPSASEVFRATDSLKRQLQEWGEYNKSMVPLSDIPFRNAARSVGHDLRLTLEDSGRWGQLGDVQASINKATSEYLPALKDFNSRFTTKINGENALDPGKVLTYSKQLGNPRAEIKQSMMKNYVDAAEKYRGEVDKLYNSLGIESPVQPSSLNAVKSTMNADIPAGAKAADAAFKSGVPRAVSTLTTKGVFSLGGSMVLGPLGGLMGGFIARPSDEYLVKPLSEAIGRPIKGHAIPAALRALSSGNPGAMGDALEYADKVNRGDSLIKQAMSNMFTAGAAKPYDSKATPKDKEKLQSFIEDGGINAQVQNTLNKQNQEKQQAPKPAEFAQGGEVKAALDQPVQSPDQPLNGLSRVYPAQSMMMESARARVYSYLNAIKPQENPQKLPFDAKPDQSKAKKHYDRATELAIHPLDILNSVKDGSITPDDMKHFTSMYPELHGHLAKRMTEKITQHQVDEEKPAYKTRQGLSMFLGAPMDSTFTPQSMQAIQGVFNMQKAANQQAGPQGKKTGGTGKLGEVPKQYQTPNQAAQERQIEAR